MCKREFLFAALIGLACTTLSIPTASAATEDILHTFTGQSDGGQPDAGLTPDGAVNFYGTTFIGGTYNWGVVYKLSHSGSGWTETVLYNFQGGLTDGGNPSGQLAIDSAGNIYGTASCMSCRHRQAAGRKPLSTSFLKTVLQAV